MFKQYYKNKESRKATMKKIDTLNKKKKNLKLQKKTLMKEIYGEVNNTPVIETLLNILKAVKIDKYSELIDYVKTYDLQLERKEFEKSDNSYKEFIKKTILEEKYLIESEFDYTEEYMKVYLKDEYDFQVSARNNWLLFLYNHFWLTNKLNKNYYIFVRNGEYYLLRNNPKSNEYNILLNWSIKNYKYWLDLEHLENVRGYDRENGYIKIDGDNPPFDVEHTCEESQYTTFYHCNCTDKAIHYHQPISQKFDNILVKTYFLYKTMKKYLHKKCYDAPNGIIYKKYLLDFTNRKRKQI